MTENLPRASSVIWDLATIQRNRKLLKIKYDHLPCTEESIQLMIDALTKQSGYDEEQITLAIRSALQKKEG